MNMAAQYKERYAMTNKEMCKHITCVQNSQSYVYYYN